jgi:hypothetical protein
VVERANGVIFAGIKRNITDLPKSKWAEELPRVIWSHNTTMSKTTQFSPFKLLYGEEAMLPEELCLGTWRDIPSSDEDLKASVQNIEEVRLQAAADLSSYQDETRRWENKKMRPKLIRSGDLVLRKVLKEKLKGKMHGKWEGPLLGNSGKPVTLETLSLIKFSKYVFQEQGIRDSRKPGTCEVSNSRMC